MGVIDFAKLRQVPKWAKIAAIAIVAVAALAVLLLAAFPVGLLRGTAERRLADALDAPVELGAVTRDSLFSFTPEIALRDVRIGQPEWVGEGDFVLVESASARVPILSLLTGGYTLRSLHITGLDIALVRDAEGNSNWAGRKEGRDNSKSGRNRLRLERLTIDDSHFSLRDAKRRLDLTGRVAASDADGLAIDAIGTFDDSRALLAARGARLTGRDPDAAWPFSLRLESDALKLNARGNMAGVLNTSGMTMEMEASGPSLKNLDYLIEAGLFGTQDIDLAAKVRRDGLDWFVEGLQGSIGRSKLTGETSVLRRDGRSKIDATIHSTQFDFDDLADDAGLARARAKQARIGPRVIPDTRIDLSKMGPTDGVIRFTIDRLLIEGGSAFRSFSGELTLDHRVLRLDKAVVGLEQGRMTGWVQVDSTAAMPILSTELRVEGTSLDTMIGSPDMIRGPLRGLVRITGPGTTIREAFASGRGKIAFVASEGSMNRTAAYVLGQDLGATIRQAIRDRDAMVPLRCAILSFDVANGVMRPAPMAMESEVSNGRGTGQINLDGERVGITINGVSKGGAALKLVDPIRVGGTLSHPAISVADGDIAEGSSRGGVLRAVGRSIGSALGLRDDEDDGAPAAPPPAALNCRAMAAAALR